MGALEDGDRIYAFGYSPTAVAMMASRTAAENAQFFLEHLKPGMQVLDVGCGPGSITIGLAAAVAPGEVLGIDIEPSQVELGKETAKSHRLDNCRFETASVHDIPLHDDSMDAVFGHTILMQFADPGPVLTEVRRVLKPGGLVGFCEADFGASLFHSEESALREALFTLRRSIFHNDGNPDIGRSLPRLIATSGLEIISAAASYNCSPTPEGKLRRARVMKQIWQEATFVDQAEQLGWLDAATRAALPARLEQEAQDPASLAATCYVEVVGRLPLT